jgi:hypothetical protein
LTVFAQKDSVDIWISRIDNSSISGTCHYAWMIEPTEDEIAKLIKAGKPAEKMLVKLLTDENKGIVAHYILSNIYRQANYRTLAMDSVKVMYDYNGLEFTESNGRMWTDKSKLEWCRAKWIKEIR